MCRRRPQQMSLGKNWPHRWNSSSSNLSQSLSDFSFLQWSFSAQAKPDCQFMPRFGRCPQERKQCQLLQEPSPPRSGIPVHLILMIFTTMQCLLKIIYLTFSSCCISNVTLSGSITSYLEAQEIPSSTYPL